MAWLENSASLASDTNGYANFTNLTVILYVSITINF